MRVPATIRRGRLTDAEEDQIVALAERGFGAGRIAMRMNRHPGTINQAMHRLGVRKLTPRVFSYRRNGVVVRSFSPDEDALLLELRTQGLRLREIADALAARFGHPRSEATLNMRLVQLSNAEAA